MVPRKEVKATHGGMILNTLHFFPFIFFLSYLFILSIQSLSTSHIGAIYEQISLFYANMEIVIYAHMCVLIIQSLV